MKLQNPYQAPTVVEAQATYYPNLVSVFIPKTPITKWLDETKSQSSGLDFEYSEKETILERSIRRTKKKISDYTLCNSFELFATFTFAKNRQDINQKRQQMSDWLRNQRKRNGKFDYLIVPEFHGDKKALHFHALFYGYMGGIRKAINPKTGEHLTQNNHPVYNLPEYTLGFTNVKRIQNSPDDQTRVAHYVKKYITKDMPVFHNKQRYWASKGLKNPIIEDNPEKWYLQVKPDWQTETENGTVLRFKIGSHPLVDIYWEAHQP